MKYQCITETEFVGHEYQTDIEYDKWTEHNLLREHLTYGPYKTKRGAENTLARRKRYWRKKGSRHPSKKSSLYDNGNCLVKPAFGELSKKTQARTKKEEWWKLPDEITFKIEEKIISEEKTTIPRN